MTERNVELDINNQNLEIDEALREATARAEHAEAELADLKARSSSQASATKSVDVATASPKVDGELIKEPAMKTSGDAEAELRKDSMMAHLLDSLSDGKDIGHYGRLTFAMVARHFMSHEEVLAWMTRDADFAEVEAKVMLSQVEAKDYNPPKRDRILAWQSEQQFPIIPNTDDPDCGNLYRNLRFPDKIYSHIEHYQEQKIANE